MCDFFFYFAYSTIFYYLAISNTSGDVLLRFRLVPSTWGRIFLDILEHEA